MPIERTGKCPTFREYVTEQALLPRAREPHPDLLDLTRYNSRWIDIPSYQRGLVWNDDLFETLLFSRSVFLGNATLGSFPVPNREGCFGRLPANVSNYEVLVDGLQRFSIGTAILTILHPLVLSSEPLRADAASWFNALRTQVGSRAPIYQHNDFELQNHPRRAVADSYRIFRRTLESWLVDRFDRGEGQTLADELQRLFLGRQIAPDTYFGFSSPTEVANTFIGLNTVRVQLNIVDWLRSVIIDRGSTSGWSALDTEALENRFTEIFVREKGDAPEPDLIPLASIIKDILAEGLPAERTRVFLTWQDSLSIDEVYRFLRFVEEMFDHESDPYVRESRQCGAIPFAGLILHYYRDFVAAGKRPAFFDGGNTEDASLRKYLRAYYRVVFEGKVARTREFARKLLLSDGSIEAVADDLSLNFLGRRLADPVDRDRLVASLKRADGRRARQVFNACLLPERDVEGAFSPLRFGKKSEHYQIDHLMPQSVVDENLPGGPEGELIMNFAPIRRTTNVAQLNIQCSAKLAAGGIYSMEAGAHPYVPWLVAEQGQRGSQLDRQELLQPLANPPIGDQRIQWLADRLMQRL